MVSITENITATTGMMIKKYNKHRNTKAAVLAAAAALSVMLIGCGNTVPAEPEPAPVLEAIPEEDTAPEGQEAAAEAEQEIAEVQQLLDPEMDLHGEAPEADTDLTALQEENPNAFAWLTLPGTEVNTAIVQGTASEGTVAIDPGNSTDFMDPNIVIHGDASSEKAPFYTLLAYGDPEYFNTHPYFYIQTDSAVLEYQVFAAYEAQKENLLVNYNYYNYNEYADYINGVFDRRDLGLVTNESLRDTVLGAWAIVTFEADEGGSDCRLIQAVLTGKQVR